MTAKRAVWEYIQARDHQVMRRVHRWRAPRWLRVWMIFASRLGDGWIWYSVGIALLLYGGDLRFIAFAASVFNGNDRVLGDPGVELLDELGGRQAAMVRG